MDVTNKKVTVLGIGDSGIESARFLKSRGAQVFLSEANTTEKTQKAEKLLRAEGFDIEVGGHSFERIGKSDFIVISPGIKPAAPIYQFILGRKIPLYSEIEVASWFCQMPTVAVTGTNGKTTVTTLIARLLNACGLPAITCGNIGNPFIGEIERINREKLIPVIEVSSFQLFNIERFKPYVGVLLNLDPDHLDWHKDLEEYYDSKFFMFKNQTAEDFAVLNQTDQESLKRTGKIPSQIRTFDGSGRAGANPNWNAVLEVAKIFGLDLKVCQASLESFEGIEHRLEVSPSGDGRRYLNDSKSTNISSVTWALERMKEPAVVIMGGRHKGGDFTVIQNLIRTKAKFVVLIGEATSVIEAALPADLGRAKAGSLREAIEMARQQAAPGETVLFSPACASFDMFKNYKDRGEQFKKLVAEITQACPKTACVS